MALTQGNLPADVYSTGEIARAADVPLDRVKALVAADRLRPVVGTMGFFAPSDAITAVRLLRSDGGRSAALLFDKPEFAHPSTKLPVAAASAFHAGVAATLILISTIGLPQAAENEKVRLEPVQTRLVFIASPGPGGGGGGGGLRQKAPPPRAQRKGKSSLDSPMPVRKPPKPIEATPKPEPPPPPPRGEARTTSSGRRTSCHRRGQRDRSPWRHRRAGAESKRKPRAGCRWRRWIRDRYRSGQRRWLGHRRRIRRWNGRRTVSPGQRRHAATGAQRSESGIHRRGTPPKSRRRGRARNRRAPGWIRQRREAHQRASQRVERARYRRRTSVAICAGDSTWAAGRRHR